MKSLAILLFLSCFFYRVSYGQTIMVQSGHAEKVNCLLFSPTGNFFSSASDDQTVKLWETSSGKMIRSFEAHSDAVWSVTFSPDELYLASSGADSTIRIWNIQTATNARIIRMPVPVANIIYSPDGSVIASATENTITIWDSKSGKKVKELKKHTGKILKLVYTIDGRFLISVADDGKIVVWANSKKYKIHTVFDGHPGGVTDISCTKNQDRFITYGKDGMIKEWSVSSKSEVTSMLVGFPEVKSITSNLQGDNFVFSNTKGQLQSGVIATKKIYQTFGISKNSATCLSFSPNGKYLLSNEGCEAIHLYDAYSKSIRYIIEPHKAQSDLVDLSVKCYSIFTSAEGKLLYANVTSPNKPFETSNIYFKKFTTITGSCGYFAGADESNTIYIWNERDGHLNEKQSFSGHIKEVNFLTFLPNSYGNMLVSSSNDRTIKIWDVGHKKMLQNIRSQRIVRSLSFTSDTKKFAAQLTKDSIWQVEISTGKVKPILFTSDTALNNIIYVRKDSFIIAASVSGRIYKWSTKNSSLKTVCNIDSPEITSVHYIEGYNWLITGRKNGVIQVWIQNDSLKLTINGHHQAISKLEAFKYENNLFLISAGKDKLMKLWNLETGELLASLMIFENDLSWVIWTPDGKYDYSENGKTHLHNINGTSWELLPEMDPNRVSGLIIDLVGASDYKGWFFPDIDKKVVSPSPSPELLIPNVPKNWNEVRKGKDFALFFINDTFEKWQSLKGSTDIVKSIASELSTNFGFEQPAIYINLTREEIMSVLEKYQDKDFSPDDQLLIYFSSHGHFDGYEGAIIPTDGLLQDKNYRTWITYSSLESMIRKIKCKHILLSIDACYSGTFGNSRGKPEGPVWTERDNCTEKLDKLLKYQSRLYLTSGGNERTPVDSQFALKWLEALRFDDPDGVLNFYELYTKLSEANPLPHQGEFKDHEPGGTFFFLNRNKDCNN